MPTLVVVLGKLRPQLTVLVGNAGFTALLGRALSLAASEAPWMKRMQVEAAGGLSGMAEAMASTGVEAIAEGSAYLVMQVLQLLVAFIGENLTMMMIVEAWPDYPMNGIEKRQGSSDEQRT